MTSSTHWLTCVEGTAVPGIAVPETPAQCEFVLSWPPKEISTLIEQSDASSVVRLVMR